MVEEEEKEWTGEGMEIAGGQRTRQWGMVRGSRRKLDVDSSPDFGCNFATVFSGMQIESYIPPNGVW